MRGPCLCISVIILEGICVLSLTPSLAPSFKVEKRSNIINKFMLGCWGTEGYGWRSLLGDGSSGTILH